MEVCSLCHQHDLEGMLSKFLKGFFLVSGRQKIHFLNGGCDTCLTKERSLPAQTRLHVPTLAGYVGQMLYVDLVSMLDTIRGNQYLLMAEDSFSRYCRVYPIPNKEAHRGQGVD